MTKLLKTPAPWFRALLKAERAAIDDDDILGALQIERKRVLEVEYLKDSIKLMRRFVKGYNASDGFSLSKIALIPQAQLNKVRMYAPQLRQETSRTEKDASTGEIREHFKVIAPRGDKQREALAVHLRQESIPNRRKFILHTDRPDQTSVKFIESYETTIDKRGRKRRSKKIVVEEVLTIDGKKYMDRFYYFDPPVFTFDAVIKQTREMLPRMPEGYYTFISSRYGDIAAMMTKGQLLNRLSEYYLGYDKFPEAGVKDDRGLAQTLLGYKFISNRMEGAAREKRNRDSNRAKFDAFRREARAKARRKALSKLRLQ